MGGHGAWPDPDAVCERCDIRETAHIIELTGPREFFLERDEVDRVAAIAQQRHTREDPVVRIAEELAPVEHASVRFPHTGTVEEWVSMGSYTELRIGKIYWSWKNTIHTFLTFLFGPDDFFAVWPKRDADEGDEGDDDYPEAIGFKTTSKRAIEALERNGFTLDLCADVYKFFDRELQRTYEAGALQRLTDTGVPENELEGRVEAHLATFPKLSKREEIAEFVAFLKVWLSSDFNSPPFDKPVVVAFDRGREYKIPPSEYMLARRARVVGKDLQFIDFENLQMYVLDKSLDFPPWVLKLCEMFDWDYIAGYPEVISLVFLRLSLEAVDRRSAITLDLADIFEVEGTRAEQEQAGSGR